MIRNIPLHFFNIPIYNNNIYVFNFTSFTVQLASMATLHLSMCTELGTLEWINFNPDFLIRISTVETFHFSPKPLFFSPLGYPLIVFSNENISVLSLVARFSLIGCYSFSND